MCYFSRSIITVLNRIVLLYYIASNEIDIMAYKMNVKVFEIILTRQFVIW